MNLDDPAAGDHPAAGVMPTPNPAQAWADDGARPPRMVPRQGHPLTDIEVEHRIRQAVADRTKGLTERIAKLEGAVDLLARAVAEHDQRFAAVSRAATKPDGGA